MHSHFLRAHPMCLVYLQEIKMRLIGGNYECIYWIHSPQTDLTSMKMTKNVSPFSFYLFFRFFTCGHNKVVSGGLLKTPMTPVINLCV